jgi:hypothetical protein
VYTLRVQPLVIRHIKEGTQNVAADFRRTGITGNTKTIPAAGYFNVEAALDLAKVLIKLTAEVGKATVVGGYQDNVPGYVWRVQVYVFTPVVLASAILKETTAIGRRLYSLMRSGNDIARSAMRSTGKVKLLL